MLAAGTITASNLSILGDFVTLNTITSNTEQMVIQNAGTGPALKVTQTGAHPIADFYDDGQALAMRIADGGNVGIGTGVPLAKLHVVGGIQVVDGTVSAPSLSFSSDTDVGLYRPGTNALGMITGGVERVRVDGSGNVGIGTINPLQKLHVEGTTRINGTDGTIVSLTPSAGASGMLRIDATAAGGTLVVLAGGGTNLQIHQASGSIRIFSSAGGASSDIIIGVTATGEVLGNVGIGTTYPLAKFHVNGTLSVQGQTYVSSFINSTDVVDQTSTADTWPVMSFSGSAGAAGLIKPVGTYDWGAIKGSTSRGYYGRVVVGLHAGSTVDQGFFTSGWTNQFVVNGSNGNAYLRGTLTQGSDARLKTNIRTMTNNLEKVMKLRPVSYNRKVFQRDANGEVISEAVDTYDKIGFIAQEVQPIIPEVVEGNASSHNPEHGLSIQYQNMLAIAIGAIQELKNEIELLKVRTT